MEPLSKESPKSHGSLGRRSRRHVNLLLLPVLLFSTPSLIPILSLSLAGTRNRSLYSGRSIGRQADTTAKFGSTPDQTADGVQSSRKCVNQLCSLPIDDYGSHVISSGESMVKTTSLYILTNVTLQQSVSDKFESRVLLTILRAKRLQSALASVSKVD